MRILANVWLRAYPLSTVGYEISYEDPETGWENWSTWYMTIYPDGTIVKRMRVYMGKDPCSAK